MSISKAESTLPAKVPLQKTSLPSIHKLTLYSALPAQGLLAQLEMGFISEPANRERLLALWKDASQAYNNLGGPARSFLSPDDIRPVEGVDESLVENTLARIKLYAPHDSHQTTINLVRISKLVTPQITLNLSRAQRRATVKHNMKPEEIFNIAFGDAGKPEPITRQILGVAPTGGALVFTSYDEDIRMYNPPEHRRIPVNELDGESPSFESVCFPVGGGYPFASALRIPVASGATRLILMNGIHRIYKLGEAGERWCPLAISDFVPMELQDPFVELPKAFLLDPNANPPLITDFLAPNVTIPLDYFTLLKTIRLNWNIEQYVTVLK